MTIKIAVIGGGPAGYPAALTAARLGAEVTLLEKAQLGGVCLHCGCIPSKSFLDAAHRMDIVADLSRFCNDGTSLPEIRTCLSWPKLKQRQLAATTKLTSGIAMMLRQAKVKVITGTAELLDKHTLTAHTPQGDNTVSFDYAIIATGSQAFIPAPFDQLSGYVYDNSTLFQLETLPRTLTIVGGGVIGCEVATFMAAFGVQVQIVEMQPRLLPTLEESLSRVVTKNLQKRGVRLLVGQAVTAAHIQNHQAVLTLTNGTAITSDIVLAAIGRRCDLTDLHLERVGLTWTRKGLGGVNPRTLQVQDNFYAAGDVTGLSLLAHAATRQGMVAAQNCCGQTSHYYNEYIPNAVYTSPELASVGLSKAQAQAQGLSVQTYKFYMLANGRAQTMDETEGFVEIIAQTDTGKILGACMAGAHVSEMISTLTVAIQTGLTVAQLQEVVFPHPTISEVIMEAVHK